MATNVPIGIAGHVTEIPGPVQALKQYCVLRYRTFAFAEHPFGYSSLRASMYVRVVEGRVEQTFRLRAPRMFSVLRDIAANVFWFGLCARTNTFIGIDSVNAFCGILLRICRRTNKVIFYVIDYTPRRCNNRALNAIYHALDRFVVDHSDEIWNISERIAKVRCLQGVPSWKNRVVGVGVNLSLVEAPDPDRRRRDLVVVSHLSESKGIQLAIRAMTQIKHDVPDARLIVIGVGPYEGNLKNLVRDLELNDVVTFKGLMQHEELFRYLSSCGIALAPYLDDHNSITYYADPTKPKEYLAAGLPVITTDVPWIADLIESAPMGIKIRYNVNELAAAAVRLMEDDHFYELCVDNARRYGRSLSWDAVYDRAFNDSVARDDHSEALRRSAP